MNAIHTPILSINPAALESVTFADLYHTRDKLNDLANAIGDDAQGEHLMSAIMQVIRHAETRPAQTLQDMFWKWLIMFDDGFPPNDGDMGRFREEVAQIMGVAL